MYMDRQKLHEYKIDTEWKMNICYFKNILKEFSKIENYKKVSIKMKKLDDIKIENTIGFIKIDVEGHELEVIKGAKNHIDKYKPVLLVEIEKRHSRRNADESISYIERLGYKCFYLKNKNINLEDTKQFIKIKKNISG